MKNLRSAALLAFALGTGLGTVSIQAAPGDSISPMSATFVDNESTYTIKIEAQESATEAGVGDLLFELNGPRLFLTTVGKGWNSAPPPTHPLAAVQAGRAGNQAVKIGGNVVELSAHGFAHSDAPHIVYLGSATADIRVEKNSGHIRVVIFTPKGQIKLEGQLATTP